MYMFFGEIIQKSKAAVVQKAEKTNCYGKL